jgi:hypothetical protein
MGVQLRQSVTVEAGHIARAPRSRTRFWLEFLARRILRLSILLFGVALVAFALAKFSPINPVDAYLGPSVIQVSPEQRELIAQRWDSPVAGDWVVELVGLEPTTRVLWKVVRVRPTPLVGRPSRSRAFCYFT